ncbi:MAG: hypothetical protein QM496_22340 [Verrucomicrobiota bacterium]
MMICRLKIAPPHPHQWISLFPALLILCLAYPQGSQAADKKTKTPVVSKGNDAASQLVNTWFTKGKAAGLEGVFYDNRDRGHSSLGITNYPQLQAITYSEDEVRRWIDWGSRRQLLPGKTVIGNSSTASPATRAGSHQRMFYTHPQGLGFLYQQYRSNALYVYPEHRDHDSGINGPNGFGDLYSANSPYLISSQGSSGTDRVFMFAMLKTIAAFPPETRKALVDKGLLMPALQAIFRQTYQASTKAEDYFTGKAHPSAFEGKLIDEVAMVKLAQGMKSDALPPLVILRITGESEAAPGRDFFESDTTRLRAGQALANSPCAISRIFRVTDYRYTMQVNATDSISPQHQKLKFRWVVLRGDPALVSIKTSGENNQKATLSVAYQARRPIEPGSAMISNRVDIGVFAEAEDCLVSPPSFISFTTLPNEHRTYTDDGRLLEIFYGSRSRLLGMPTAENEHWDALLARFDVPSDQWSPDTQLLTATFKKDQIAILTTTAADTKKNRALIASADKKLDVIVTAQQKVVDEKNKIRRAALAEHKKLDNKESKITLDAATAKYSAARKVLRDGKNGAAELKTEIAGLHAKVAVQLKTKGVPDIISSALETLRADLDFSSANQAAIQNAAEQSSNKKVKNLLNAALGRLKFVAVTKSDNPPLNDRYHIEQLNLDILSEVLFPDFLQRTSGLNYFDSRLTDLKNWRDVYRYSKDGKLLGWTRYQNSKPSEFTSDGELVLSRKDDGSPDKVANIRYEIDPKSKQLRTVEAK